MSEPAPDWALHLQLMASVQQLQLQLLQRLEALALTSLPTAPHPAELPAELRNPSLPWPPFPSSPTLTASISSYSSTPSRKL